MATIRKREAHQWQATIRKTGDPRYSSTFKTKADAVRWADKIEESIKNDTCKDILKADHTAQYRKQLWRTLNLIEANQSILELLKEGFRIGKASVV